VVKHSLIVGYADDHTLLKIVSHKCDRLTTESQLNDDDLVAISQFGKAWQIKFTISKTFSLPISLKCNLLSCPHPLLIMDHIIIPKLVQPKFWGLNLIFHLHGNHI